MIELFTWNNVAGFLNSNFTSALAGALTGAFAGAMAAQRIADRTNQRKVMLEEIRSTNAAIMVAFTICNAGLALKKKFVKDIHETYTAKKLALQEFKQRRALGQQPADLPFEFQADFRTLQMPLVPIDVLRTQLYEKISATGRPLALVAALVGSVAALDDVIKKRNALIERFRSLGEENPQLPALYFGLPYGPGHVSTEFMDTVESMSHLTDDVIFFSELLGIDLMAHGNRVLRQYEKIAKVKEEKISVVDLSDPRKQGLMPDAANYVDWIKNFPNAAQPTAPPDAFGASAPRRG